MTTEIETERLRLRPLSEQDSEALWEIYSEPSVREHLITRPETRDAFAQIFGAMLHYSAAGRMWGVVEKTTGRLIGRCGFYEFGEARTPELAFLFRQTSWGRGLATEASQAAIGVGLERRRWSEIVAVVRPANSGAKRVLQKLSFSLADTMELRGQPAELHLRPGGAD